MKPISHMCSKSPPTCPFPPSILVWEVLELDLHVLTITFTVSKQHKHSLGNWNINVSLYQHLFWSFWNSLKTISICGYTRCCLQFAAKSFLLFFHLLSNTVLRTKKKQDKYHIQFYCTFLCLLFTTLELGCTEKVKKKILLSWLYQKVFNINRRQRKSQEKGNTEKLKGCIISA